MLMVLQVETDSLGSSGAPATPVALSPAAVEDTLDISPHGVGSGSSSQADKLCWVCWKSRTSKTTTSTLKLNAYVHICKCMKTYINEKIQLTYIYRYMTLVVLQIHKTLSDTVLETNAHYIIIQCTWVWWVVPEYPQDSWRCRIAFH